MTMKMKNRRYTKFVGAALLVPAILATSCKKDFLETAPKTTLSDVNAFSTPDRIVSQVNGVYAALKNGAFLGGLFHIYNDIRAEEFIVNKPNGVTGLDTWRHNLLSNTSEVTGLWSAAYTAINRANIVLEGVAANANVVGATKAAEYMAQAKFARALAYHSLLQLYAKPYTADNGASPGVPLRLKAEKDVNNNDLARATVAQVYAQILKDLNEAENELPATGVATMATKNTAIALKTRVYLNMANYAQVITEGNKIVSAAAPFVAPTGRPNKLETSIATVFGGSYV